MSNLKGVTLKCSTDLVGCSVYSHSVTVFPHVWVTFIRFYTLNKHKSQLKTPADHHYVKFILKCWVFIHGILNLLSNIYSVSSLWDTHSIKQEYCCRFLWKSESWEFCSKQFQPSCSLNFLVVLVVCRSVWFHQWEVLLMIWIKLKTERN